MDCRVTWHRLGGAVPPFKHSTFNLVDSKLEHVCYSMTFDSHPHLNEAFLTRDWTGEIKHKEVHSNCRYLLQALCAKQRLNLFRTCTPVGQVADFVLDDFVNHRAGSVPKVEQRSAKAN